VPPHALGQWDDAQAKSFAVVASGVPHWGTMPAGALTSQCRYVEHEASFAHAALSSQQFV
jgi:hypothetical protein